MREPRVVMLKHSDIMACPHIIMVPEHYRDDGTCRCNDRKHLVMKSWGYKWNTEAKRWHSSEGEEDAA